MADMRRGLHQQRHVPRHKLGAEQLAVARQRAEAHGAVSVRLAASVP